MLLAQLSDTHVKLPGRRAYGVVDTAAALAAAVAHLLGQRPRPDAVVITGDLVDRGTSEEYDHLQRLLAPLAPLPVFPVAGNHDERQALRRAFPSLFQAEDFLHYTVSLDDMRLIVLDTLIPGEGGGALCGERLAWLEARLSEAPGHPTCIAMHHPPFRTGIAHMDAIGLDGAEAFAAVMIRHPQVQRILCGHLHRPIQAMVGGRLAMTAPGTSHQVALDLTPDGASAFMLEPAGYLLHAWHGGGVATHTAVVGDFPGPFPFFGDDGRLID